MSTETNSEDYVLVHKSKAKLSRARKGIIGLMAIGAAVAISGAGTFASFSASTTNDGVFKTGRLELSNKVNSGTSCLSSDLGPGNTATADANLDQNDTLCDDLFASNLAPGTTSTANITLHNSSTYTNANLFLFGTDDTNAQCTAVVNDATFRGGLKGSGNICNVVKMTVQEFTDNTFATPVTNKCTFPFDNAANCPALDNTSQPTQLISAFPWNYSNGGGNRNLGSFATGGDRFFRVSVRMPDTGVNSTTGVGNENPYQNQKPSLKLRWLIQSV